jgi:hypothetical protein
MATRTFKRYTLEEYIAYLHSYIGRVHFPEVHVHATWKPTIANFRLRPGDYYIRSMYRSHLLRGFTDIAQHATIDPDGYVWEGRPLTVAPASSTGYNDPDNDGIHPFMFEMIGDFDIGKERLEGAQLRTSIGLTRALVDIFGSRIVFHREMDTKGKTCPGSGIDKAEFLRMVSEFGNGDDGEMETAAVYVNDKRITDGKYDAEAGIVYVPVRAVANEFGAKSVTWDAATKTVRIAK